MDEMALPQMTGFILLPTGKSPSGMPSDSCIQEPNVEGISKSWSSALLERIEDSKQRKLGKWMGVKGQMADS